MIDNIKDENLKNYILLLRACIKNDLDTVKQYLDKGDYINGIYYEGKPYYTLPLFESLINRSKEVSLYLLENGADPNKEIYYWTKPNDEDEPGYYLVLLTALIRFQAGDGNNDSRQEYYNMLDNLYPFLELLVNYGADVNKAGEDGYTALDYAVEYNHPNAKRLIKKKGGLHSKRFVDTEYKIYYRKEPTDKIKYIETKFVNKKLPPFHHDIKWEYKNYKDRGIPLNIGFMQIYCDKGIDINQKDWKGRTPLDYAIDLGHHIAVDFLRQHGGKTSQELEVL